MCVMCVSVEYMVEYPVHASGKYNLQYNSSCCYCFVAYIYNNIVNCRFYSFHIVVEVWCILYTE